MNFSNRYQLFLAAVALLFLLNLLVANDFATLWNGAESTLIWQVLNGEGNSLPHLFLSDFVQIDSLNLFSIRSIGPALLLLSFFGYYYYGRKVFGKEAVIMCLAVLAASLLLPNLAKRATADLYLFAAQSIGFVTLLRYLKQPQLLWQLGFYVCLVLSIWLQPIGSLLFFLLASTMLFFWHPQGRRLLQLNPWAAAALLVLALYFTGLLRWASPIFEFGWGSGHFGKYLFWTIVGFLPFFGFLLGGIRETIKKSRKGEELAVINTSFGIAAFAAQSMVLQLLFAFLVAKQLQLYFHKNYPHENWVKTGAILHLLLAFGLAFFLMMGGIFQFKGLGFRAGAVMGGLYWILSFTAVIGLYGKVKRLVVVGVLLSGLLASQLFWLQVYPLVESKRNIPQRYIEWLNSQKQLSADTLYIYSPADQPFPNLATYGKTTFKEVKLLDSYPQSLEIERQTSIVRLESITDPGIVIKADTLSGWDDRLRSVSYLLVPASGALENKEE